MNFIFISVHMTFVFHGVGLSYDREYENTGMPFQVSADDL